MEDFFLFTYLAINNFNVVVLLHSYMGFFFFLYL